MSESQRKTQEPTPGPWRVEVRQTKCSCGKTDDGSIGYVRGDGPGHEIAVIYMHDRHEADARLIAAAPDGLDASRAFITFLDGLEGDHEFSMAESERLIDARNKALAFLAKVDG